MSAGVTVSVVINCYNHEPYVGEAIESVLKQSLADLELILIDNGSTDGSRAVMQSYSDPRIRHIFHDDNRSLSRRLNEGVAAARGEFVSILYSDDLMRPHKLEHQVQLMRKLGPDYGVVYAPPLALNQLTGERWQHPTMRVSGPMMPAILNHHYDGSIDMCTPLTRRVCYERYRWHDDLFGDGEMIFFRIAMSWRFHFDPTPVVILRDHGSNMGKALKQNSDMMFEILDRLQEHPDFPSTCRSDLKHFRAVLNRNVAWSVLRMSNQEGSWVRSRLVRAIRLEPKQVLHPKTLIGMAVASLPSRIQSGINSVGNRLRPKPENRALVLDY